MRGRSTTIPAFDVTINDASRSVYFGLRIKKDGFRFPTPVWAKVLKTKWRTGNAKRNEDEGKGRTEAAT